MHSIHKMGRVLGETWFILCQGDDLHRGNPCRFCSEACRSLAQNFVPPSSTYHMILIIGQGQYDTLRKFNIANGKLPFIVL